MRVILDAHVSRSNTSGSVPPMLLPPLKISHVAAAQLVAQVKVYVPTLKRSTAHRGADHTRACSGSLHCGAARPTNGGVHVHAAAAHAARDGKAHPERPSASPLQATTAALHAWRRARGRGRRTSRLQHTVRAVREMQRAALHRAAHSIHGAAHCAHRARSTPCCNEQHGVLRPATRGAATCSPTTGNQHRSGLQPAAI